MKRVAETSSTIMSHVICIFFCKIWKNFNHRSSRLVSSHEKHKMDSPTINHNYTPHCTDHFLKNYTVLNRADGQNNGLIRLVLNSIITFQNINQNRITGKKNSRYGSCYQQLLKIWFSAAAENPCGMARNFLLNFFTC